MQSSVSSATSSFLQKTAADGLTRTKAYLDMKVCACTRKIQISAETRSHCSPHGAGKHVCLQIVYRNFKPKVLWRTGWALFLNAIYVAGRDGSRSSVPGLGSRQTSISLLYKLILQVVPLRSISRGTALRANALCSSLLICCMCLQPGKRHSTRSILRAASSAFHWRRLGSILKNCVRCVCGSAVAT